MPFTITRRRLARLLLGALAFCIAGYILASALTRFTTDTLPSSLSQDPADGPRPIQLKHHPGDFIDPPFTFSAPPAEELAPGCLLFITRTISLTRVRRTMFDIEKRFNDRYHYPYVFLSEEPFSDQFQKAVRAMANGASVEFGLITENWGYPDWVDKSRAHNEALDWADRNDMDADTQGYRHMVRYWAQPFADHPALQKYRYVWRLEPGAHYTCDFVEDPLTLMQSRNLTYGFAISIQDNTDSIPSLWATAQSFMHDNLNMMLSRDNSLEWLLTRHSSGLVEFNRCLFLTNFEIVDLTFVRSQLYRKLFEYLDRRSGFYYERWSDASVRSLAAAMFLKSDDVHWFSDVGYKHDFLQHCPSELNRQMLCHCDPKKSTHMYPMSCSARWNDGKLGIDPRNLIQ